VKKNKPNSTALVVVWALVRPAMKWQAVSDPIIRSSAVLVIRDRWAKGELARIRPAPVAKAA
jgi:hypothetical protein